VSEVEVFYDDNNGVITTPTLPSGLQLYKDATLNTSAGNEIDATDLNSQAGTNWWAIKSATYFGEIQINSATGQTTSVFTNCQVSYLDIRFIDGNGTTLTQASEGEAVKLDITAVGDLNGVSVNYDIDANSQAEYDDINLSTGGQISLTNTGFNADPFKWGASFNIVLENDSLAEGTEELIFSLTDSAGNSMSPYDTVAIDILDVSPTPTPSNSPTPSPSPTPTPSSSGLIGFACSDVNLDLSALSGLSVGTTIDISLIVTDAGVVTAVSPVDIQSGSATYAVTVSVPPSGWSNSGQDISCDGVIVGDSAPTASNLTISLDSEEDQVINIFTLVSDDTDADTALTITLGNLNPIISGSSLTPLTNGETTYQAPQLVFADGDKTQTFDYTAVDTAGNSSTGTVTINITAETNIAPVFVDANGNNITEYSISTSLNQTTAVSTAFDATDLENHSITYQIAQGVKGVATLDQTNKTVSYIPNTGSTSQDTVVLTATDSEGASTDINIAINISFPAFFEIDTTSFFNNEDDACLEPTNTSAWFATQEATQLSDLEVGDTLYTSSSFSATKGSTGAATYCKLVSGNQEQVVTLDQDGKILTIGACQAQSNLFEKTRVRYSGSETNLCNDLGGEVVEVFYGVNAPGDPSKNLQTLVIDNTYLFVSSYRANQFANGFNVELEGLIPAGLYQAETEPVTYYKRGVNNEWTQNGGSLSWDCPEPLDYNTYSLGQLTYATSVDEVCGSYADTQDIYYRLPEVNSGQPAPAITFLELSQGNIPIFVSQLAADENLIEGLAPAGVYADTNGDYLVWDNEGDGFGFNWFGFNNQNQFVKNSEISKLGSCATYIRPTSDTSLQFTAGDGGINDTNVYYVFYACNSNTDQINSGSSAGTLSQYWNLYVVDAGFDITMTDEGNSVAVNESPLKGLIDSFTGTDVQTIQPRGYDCLTFIHTVWSETMADAVNIIKDKHTSQYIKVSGINSVDIGLGSEQEISIYTGDNCDLCGDPTENPNYTYNMPIMDDSIIEALGPNFELESNYKLDNVSKPLLRTNPKLTTNVKLVVSKDDNLYLESINASKELAAIEYKKFSINKDGRYAYDIANFYNVNSTPNELMFQTKRDYSDITVLDSYEKQIEESYQYGTNYNFSKSHTEDFRIFAPIWLDTHIPRNFVIYRINDPVGSLQFKDNAADNLSRIKSLLKNSEIIKSFDLTRNSNIGTYLRNHVQDETFPSAPITVNFEKSEKSNFNGIDLIKGGFTSKGEYLYKDYVLTDKPLIEANDYITDAFRRNQIASANLINLEFLFDDDLASEYSVNRYFGLFVDEIDSGYGRIFSIDGKIHHFKELNSLVDAIKPETAIPSYKQITTMPMLAYASAGNKLFNISSNTVYDAKEWKVAIEDGGNYISDQLGIKDTGRSIDLVENNDHGYDFIKLNITNTPSTNDSLGITNIKEEANKFTFIKHVEGETIVFAIDDPTNPNTPKTFSIVAAADMPNTIKTIYNKVTFGTSVNDIPLTVLEDSELFRDIFDITYDTSVSVGVKSLFFTERHANLGDLNLRILSQGDCIVRNDEIQTNLNLQNSIYRAESQIDAGRFEGYRYSNQGTTTNVAVALAACIDSNETRFSAHNVGSIVYIVSKVSGYELMQSCLLLGKGNVNEFLTLENADLYNRLQLRETIDLLPGQSILERYDAYFLSGGNAPRKSVFINNETLSEVNVNDYIETRYANVYNKVIDVVEDITRTNSDFSKVILEDKNDLTDGDSKVYYENEVRLGLFSAYDMYDLNVDFYDTSNSDIKELVYETQSEIDYEPYTNAVNNIDETTGLETTILSARDIFSEDFELNPIDYFSNLSKILTEESVDDEENDQITSEFDRLKENNLKKYATNSRVVPNINKWVLKDAVTVREQPYYLNVNEAFGRTNFSPDLTTSERDRESMTHEWFYMEKPPKYLKYNEINDTFSYVNFIEGFDLSANLFKSTVNNYFDMFMISDGFEKKLTSEDLVDIYDDIFENDPEINSLEDSITSYIKTNLLKKYSLVDGGNNISHASTVFKGIKVDFKNRKEFVNTTASEFVNSSEFNGYKFSVLLKVNEDAETNSISYEVIQNKQFKFVIMYITLNLGDFWIDNNMNRKLLYQLNHKIVFDSNLNDFTYADTKFNGALQFNDSSINWSDEGPYTIPGISHITGTLPQFDSQITLGDNGLYGDIHIDLFPNDSTNSIYKVSVTAVDSDNSLKISGKPINVVDENDILDIEFLPNSIQGGAVYTYVGGGANAHKVILEDLTAKSVADLVNLNNDEITYTTVDVDGTVLNNRFVINFSDGTEIIQRSNLNIEEDTDKPKSFKLFKGNIGYNLMSDSEYYPFLIRHNGNYTVDMKPIVTFTDAYSHFKVNRLHLTNNTNELRFEESLYKHSLTKLDEFNRADAYYRRYNKCGITFNLGFISDDGTHDSMWGLIKNHFYHKVNEINPSGVTKLSSTSDKLPLYPLIGEIAIDKKDINVFRSSWDSEYYTRSLAGGNSTNVPGTLDTHEERSYLASTVMKPKDSYNLLDFNTSYVTSEEELDDILRNSANTSNVVLYENKNHIIADFYITDTLITKLAKDGVLESISRYVSPVNSAGNKETLTDDALLYAENNLIETYILDSIQLYTKQFKGKGSKIINAVTIDQLDSDGFTLDKNNFAYRSHVQKPMNFRLIYNKRLGYSYDIKPMIKIKS
jgi:hypothetical protein